MLTKNKFYVISKLAFKRHINVNLIMFLVNTMILLNKKNLLTLLSFLLVGTTTLLPSHNTNRYFPFLEKSEHYLYKKRSQAHAALFYASASTAFKRGGGNAGVYELGGKYDLADVFRSYEEFKTPKVGHAPASLTRLKTDLASFDDKTEFKAEGKIKARGLILQYEHDLKWNNFSIGAWLPLVIINTTSRFNPTDKTLLFNEKINLNSIRRSVHDGLELKENNWDKGGIGDLDVYLRWNYFVEHQLMMRSISFNIQAGCLFPTSIDADTSHYSSVSLMGSGHWGLYLNIAPEFELKQNIKAGLILGATYQFKNTQPRRIPIYNEPAIFSPLVGKAKVDPGMTWKISPYVTLENLTDGIHFQARYTYLRHNTDKWTDVRPDKEKTDFSSYLTRKTTTAYPDITQEKINENIANKKNLSKWRSHYITLQATYNSKDALHNLPLDPNIYVMYDIPINGRGISKTHQISLGVELHF